MGISDWSYCYHTTAVKSGGGNISAGNLEESDIVRLRNYKYSEETRRFYEEAKRFAKDLRDILSRETEKTLSYF